MRGPVHAIGLRAVESCRGMGLRNGASSPFQGLQYSLHCGALPSAPQPLAVHVVTTSLPLVPAGLQSLHTPLGPVILYADSAAPPALLAR